MNEWLEAYWESCRATGSIPVQGEPTALELAKKLDALLRTRKVSQKTHLARLLSAALVLKIKEESCTTT